MNPYSYFQLSKSKDVFVALLIEPRLFDSLRIAELQDELLAMIEVERPTRLLVNFERVTQCSTSVINALLSAKKRLRLKGGDLRLCRLTPEIREAYKLLNLDGTVFHIHDTESDGVAAFGSGGR